MKRIYCTQEKMIKLSQIKTKFQDAQGKIDSNDI